VERGPLKISLTSMSGWDAYGGAVAYGAGQTGYFWIERGNSPDDQALFFRGLNYNGTPLHELPTRVFYEEWEISAEVYPTQANFMDNRFGAVFPDVKGGVHSIRYVTICPE
jgi:hypothetical protein